MYNFKDFLQELGSTSGIIFKLTGEDGDTLYASDSYVEDSEKIYFPIYLGNNKNIVSISQKDEACIKLLKYTIENKYREIYSVKEQSIVNLLESKEIDGDSELSFLCNGSKLLLLNITGSKYDGINVIQQMYSDENIVSVVYKDNIVVIGYFDDVNEHAVSIREAIMSNLFCECRISYSKDIKDQYELKEAYEDARECLMLGKKFGLKDGIFDCTKLLFEKIVYNIEPKLKQELLNKFKDKFNQFDGEVINTIDEFMKNGLNISDAARKLYIHRNTLIYRLDKIKKETGFDIRNFKEATVFTTAFLVWKEMKN
ncbi:PucR family transcriptional regulator [Clostridium hydrogenum]|uniref:PucR family transcriptional regulator n=1 Tax=Clostridium hydrogenum TaxID=2855764 RepID=UPI001F2DD8BA|nr:helix-turn-helix domain-containing protein [Clostridium hydrogenum]